MTEKIPIPTLEAKCRSLCHQIDARLRCTARGDHREHHAIWSYGRRYVEFRWGQLQRVKPR